jgi:hypothetical protein
MALVKKIVEYENDLGETLTIIINYSDEAIIEPDDRAELGELTTDVDCGLITTRRKLKPRQIIVRATDDENEQRLGIYVKTKDKYNELLENNEIDGHSIIKYIGEEATFCPPPTSD